MPQELTAFEQLNEHIYEILESHDLTQLQNIGFAEHHFNHRPPHVNLYRLAHNIVEQLIQVTHKNLSDATL